MNPAIIYRPNNRKLIWIAFACAIMIYLGAIAIAENKTRPVSLSWGGDSDDPVIGFDYPPLPPEETILPPEPTVVENQEFTDENLARPPVHPQRKSRVAGGPRATGISAARTMGFGSAKALTLYAPRPAYPYEARRGGITGSGVAQLTVNSAAGNVLDARMAQSTGSAFLDNATLQALRKWRFKSGVAENVDVPITFTLTGVSY